MVTDPQTGAERMIIRPSLSNSTREVIAGMADIYGYAHQLRADENSVLTLRCGDGSIQCGCRFKYIENQIPMSYHSLVNAISAAIDKEAAEHNGEFVTNERSVIVQTTEYDYDALMNEFKDVVGQLMSSGTQNAPKITNIVEKYLGKGKKVNDTTPEQAEFIYLILNDIKAELM